MLVQRSGDWRWALAAAHPALFSQTFQGRIITPGKPEVGNGWRDLVETAVSRIAAAVAADPIGSASVDQIKGKFGSLRLYYQTRDLQPATALTIGEAVDLAEARSACTCEECGAEGRLFNDSGWFSTRCDIHRQGKPVRVRPGWERLQVIRHYDGDAVTVTCRRYDREADRFIEVDPATVYFSEE